MFPGSARVWHSLPPHVPALLSLQQVGLYSAASDLFGSYGFEITPSVLTSSEGASFTAVRELGCPACSNQTRVDAVSEAGFGAVEPHGMR